MPLDFFCLGTHFSCTVVNMFAAPGQWRVSSDAKCCSCICLSPVSRSRRVCGVCLCKMPVNVPSDKISGVPALLQKARTAYSAKSNYSALFIFGVLCCFTRCVNKRLACHMGLLAKVTGLYHRQLWLLLFPWFPPFRKGRRELPLTATTCLPEGSSGIICL